MNARKFLSLLLKAAHRTALVPSICCVLFLLLCGAGHAQPIPQRNAEAGGSGQNWAVIVGVKDFLYNINSLPSSIQDATAFRTTLPLLPDHVVQLMSGGPYASQRATKANIERAIRQMALRAKPEDTFWFYYSGHGTSRAGSSFLIPEDARIESPATWIAVRDLRRMLESAPGCRARCKVLVLDACCSGANKGADIQRVTWQQILGSAQGIVTMAACQVDESARDLGYPYGSLFTYFLLRGLAGDAAAPGSNSVTLGGLQNFVSAAVRKVSGETQSPVFISTMRANMPIAQRDAAALERLASAPTQGSSVREPLKPALIICLQEDKVREDATTDITPTLQRALQRQFVQKNYPVVTESAALPFLQVLETGEAGEAGQQAAQMNARFLLRGTVRVKTLPNLFNTNYVTVQASIHAEIVDVNGHILASDSFLRTGNGIDEDSATQRALDHAANRLFAAFEPAAQQALALVPVR